MSDQKAQSAMEYLMTYGWAIIVILVVLAVLYILGIFTPNRILGNQCNVLFKFSCNDLYLATNGSVSFLLGQNSGTTEYNIAIACTQSANATGGPLPSTAWVYLNASGATKSSYSSSSTYLFESGTSVFVNDVPCYSGTGALLGSKDYGTAFSGNLWIRYTNLPGTQGGANLIVINKIASVSTTVGAGGSASTSASTSTTTISSGTFLTGSNSSSGFAPLSGTFTSYVCSGSTDAGKITANYSIDAGDAYTNMTAIGRGTKICDVPWPGPALACKYSCYDMADVGLNGAPTPTVFPDAVVYSGIVLGPTGTLNYTVSNAGSFVIIAAACGSGFTCSLSLPSGCTQRQDAVDGGGDSSLIATCQSQAIGKYFVNITASAAAVQAACAVKPYPGMPLGECNPISMVAYVYPNYAPSGS